MKYAHQALFPIVTRTIHESDLTTVFWQTIRRTSMQYICIFHGVVKINELKKLKSQHLLLNIIYIYMNVHFSIR
jgi:hypothetical protein